MSTSNLHSAPFLQSTTACPLYLLHSCAPLYPTSISISHQQGTHTHAQLYLLNQHSDEWKFTVRRIYQILPVLSTFYSTVFWSLTTHFWALLTTTTPLQPPFSSVEQWCYLKIFNIDNKLISRNNNIHHHHHHSFQFNVIAIIRCRWRERKKKKRKKKCNKQRKKEI